jgi:DNA-binding transcriptional MocR family regulator
MASADSDNIFVIGQKGYRRRVPAGPPVIEGQSAAEIVASVRSSVALGRLQDGAVLPPVRALAEQLGVNRNTVAAAYRQLAERGVVEGRGRAGTLITAPEPLRGEGIAWPAPAIDLAGGNPDPDLLPDLRSALAAVTYEPPLYGAPAVLPALRDRVEELFSEDLDGAHGLSVTHGALDAIERLLGSALVRGDRVAIEDPGYLASTGIVAAMGLRPVGVPVDQRGIDPVSLEASLRDGVRAVVCTSRAQNPTGASIDADRARALRQVLAAFPDVFVIEDDHLSVVAKTEYQQVRSSRTARWALVRSMAKILGPDLRLAVVASDPRTEEELGRRLAAGVNWVSHLLQATTAALLSDPATSGRLTKARAEYERRSGHLQTELRRHGIACATPSDGLNLWVPLTGNEAVVVDELARRGWQVRPGSAYAVDPTRGRPGLRVTTSAISRADAARFAKALASVLALTQPTEDGEACAR